MATRYNGVKRLATQHHYFTVFGQRRDWLLVVKACYELAGKYETFPGAWVVDEVGWFPSLQLLARYGILVKRGTTVRRGSRAYYAMPDRNGVGRALHELSYL